MEVFMTDQNNQEDKSTVIEEQKTPEVKGSAEKITAAGWGFFFIWIGVAYIFKLDVGVGLLGVGIITLGGQMARKSAKLKFEGFWIIVGLLFFMGGLWEVFKPNIPLVPILLIAAGLTLLLSTTLKKRK